MHVDTLAEFDSEMNCRSIPFEGGRLYENAGYANPPEFQRPGTLSELEHIKRKLKVARTLYKYAKDDLVRFNQAHQGVRDAGGNEIKFSWDRRRLGEYPSEQELETYKQAGDTQSSTRLYTPHCVARYIKHLREKYSDRVERLKGELQSLPEVLRETEANDSYTKAIKEVEQEEQAILNELDAICTS